MSENQQPLDEEQAVPAVGYFIGSRLEKKREAALADEQAALEQPNDTNA